MISVVKILQITIIMVKRQKCQAYAVHVSQLNGDVYGRLMTTGVFCTLPKSHSDCRPERHSGYTSVGTDVMIMEMILVIIKINKNKIIMTTIKIITVLIRKKDNNNDNNNDNYDCYQYHYPWSVFPATIFVSGGGGGGRSGGTELRKVHIYFLKSGCLNGSNFSL